MIPYPHLDISKLHATLSKYDESKSIITELAPNEITILFNLNFKDSDDAYARISLLFNPDPADSLEEYPVHLPIEDTTDFYPLVEKLLRQQNAANDLLVYRLHSVRTNYWMGKEDEAKEEKRVKASIMLWEAQALHDYYLGKLLESQPDKLNYYIGRVAYWHWVIQDMQNQKVKQIGSEEFPSFAAN